MYPFWPRLSPEAIYPLLCFGCFKTGAIYPVSFFGADPLSTTSSPAIITDRKATFLPKPHHPFPPLHPSPHLLQTHINQMRHPTPHPTPPLTHAQDRVFNFATGPATLPEKVLLRAQSELYNWGGSDMSGVFAPSSRSRRSILSSSSRAAPQPSSPPCRSTSAPLTTSSTSSSRAPPGRKWHTGTVRGLTLSHFCEERERESARERERGEGVAEGKKNGSRNSNPK
ncbi:phosphoserine aminotransferase [Vigna unguiculata]|uniref:Phosphoserine aminotransferase n=1 Tax=Vigna unguiculata TaxID=3917 RepID=A0A4D6KSF9_VIGUN|nr:phosphoserine aminotransferase [Vigna unguiculata]